MAIAENHPSIVITQKITPPWWLGFRARIFCLFLSRMRLGDFLKINSKKNLQKIFLPCWLGFQPRRFCLFKPHTLGDFLKINSKKLTKNHPSVVIGVPAADFLLIKPHDLGDFLKINSKKTHKKSFFRGDCGSEQIRKLQKNYSKTSKKVHFFYKHIENSYFFNWNSSP